ncbi:MAG: hypothetical protein LH606_08675 [Cytophagaceae bacterium]|nr:hypothetical protein [Cytophagaceae bacterium]
MKKERINLDDLPRKQPFSVPEGYFDTLPQRIQAQVVAPAPAFRFHLSWQRVSVSLAAFSLVAVLIWQTLPPKQGSLGTDAISQVSNETILEYLTTQNLTPYDLVDHLDQVSILTSGEGAVLQQLNITDEDILHHLKTEDLEDVL